MRVLSKEDIKACIDMPKAIALMADAFKEISVGEGKVPVRHFLTHQSNHTTGLFMPALLPKSEAFGIKIVGMNLQNLSKQLPLISASILLLDTKTGQPAAIMEGSWITALRTGAGSGLATKLLAKQEADKLLVFGAGKQAETQIEAVCSVRNIKSIKVLNRSKDNAKSFCRRVTAKLAIPTSLGTYSDLKNTDIICTATTTSDPLFKHNQLGKGVHINAIGAFTPEMAEVPSETLAEAKVFVDDKEACFKEAGDIIQAINKGLLSANDITGELGELVDDKIEGRTNDHEITFFKSVGNAAQDMVVANFVLQEASKKGLGKQVNL